MCGGYYYDCSPTYRREEAARWIDSDPYVRRLEALALPQYSSSVDAQNEPTPVDEEQPALSPVSLFAGSVILPYRLAEKPTTSSDVREERANRRSQLREEWLRNQEVKKATNKQRKAQAEERGAEWAKERAIAQASTDIELHKKFKRKPLGRWTKGKVWSNVAEMYV
tara:strand:- start:645 stop:1145 length:501 start_codon:yes stop_codon:yes gene_type:complete